MEIMDCSNIAPCMYKSVEGTLANMGNMLKQYWSNIAPILGAIGGVFNIA